MSTASPPALSIIIPAYNEAAVIGSVLDEILALGLDAEILVVDDGSTDGTSQEAGARAGVRVITHPYNIGNGAAVKTGIRNACGELILLMDGDGQHRPADIPRLLDGLDRYDMVVGARTRASNTERHRDIANWLYNRIASYITAYPVADLTSGFRALRAPIARSFVYLLPNGYSYPTTLTIALFRGGYSVRYEPIVAAARTGRSKIRLLRDGIGFLLTLLRIGTLFTPMRIFLPVSAALTLSGGLYVAYSLIALGRFSGFAGLLVLSGIMLFMLGLISEQIALLRMSQASFTHREDSFPHQR